MRTITTWLPPLAVALLMAGSAQAGGAGAQVADGWLMMVATRCTDPAREAQFNAWYDDIDIPDVLEVPGYMRARRGLRLGTPTAPVAALPDSEGRYVALYDIDSAAIDKTIIEMLMATRKMESRGRSTDLLKVTERVYYQQHAPSVEAPTAARAGGDEYFLVERADCCRDAAAEGRFNDWYDRTHIPEVLKRPGFVRATRYELYRVLMIEPKVASRFLTVYELRADTPGQATAAMTSVIGELRTAAHANDSIVEAGSLMYRKIRDVKRP